MIKKDEGIDPYPYYKFVSRAFYELRGYKLGQQAYIFYLCYWLTSLWSGVIRKLIINLPPKHLKTFMCTICMVAWTLAHRPRLDILVVTCSEELADEIGKSIVALLQTPWYISRYGRRLIRKHVDPTNFQTPQGGTVRVVAVGSKLTGLRSDLTIADDLHELKHMRNPSQIEFVKELYHTTVSTRFNHRSRGRTLIVQHRVHEDDLSAELAEEDDFKRIALPLVAPNAKTYKFGGRTWYRPKGDVLRPDEFTRKDIEKLRSKPQWPLLYQQGMDRAADSRLKRSDFRVVGRDQQVAGPCVISVDPGVGEHARNSYSCFQVWTPLGRQRYQLNEQCCERQSFQGQKATLRGLYHRYRPSAILIESTATGPALIEYARDHFACEIVPIFPRGSKFDRLQSVLHVFRHGEVTLFLDGPYVEEVIQEATNFPYDDHDDVMDAMTQMFHWGETSGNLPLKPIPRGGVVAGLDSNFTPLQVNRANVIQGPHSALALGSRTRPWWRDHFR